MPPYKELESGEIYFGKFVRIGENIFVTKPFVIIDHVVLIKEENQTEALSKMKKESPVEVDAGLVTVNKSGEILLDSHSSQLHLPMKGYENEARERSGIVFQTLSPNHTVVVKGT